MKRILCVMMTIILLCSISSETIAKITPDFSLLPPGTNVSLLAQYTSGKQEVLLSHQTKQLRIPASTQKIVTALAALLELGPDYRFTTQFMTKGSITNDTLNGDLILSMHGDPTFTRQQLTAMVTKLKQKGISHVTGNIVIDTSIFSGHDKAEGWSWNNLTFCYNTAPSASIIDGNCFYATLTPATQVGKPAIATVASQHPVQIDSHVMTTKKDSDNRYCNLDILVRDNNNYQLTGCMKITEKKRSFHFAVMDGSLYVAKLLRNYLKQAGITFNGKIIESKHPINSNKVTVLATNTSAPLSSLLTDMLKNSNNLIADAVFRTIGAHYFNMPGTWLNSSDAVRQILKKKANIDLKNNVVIDGSGLSRLNLLNAETMLKILQFIANHDKQLNMINMFPIAGVDGTLQYRRSLNKVPFKQTVFAKTGHLEGSYNLAGFIKTKSNRYIAFVQFLTGYQMLNKNRPKKEAVMKFEESLYTQCLNKIN
ncbi:serine-type D-Ala-D-Ala carboxypeptidase [Candidatus Schmidhempelia bombi]|nr:serine-type D-Ala-D-Ala carboxypeptidase [Candidatus Schmidhempelia bombi]